MNGGTADIREQRWFVNAGFNWEDCAAKKGVHEKGPFPIVMRGPDDVSAFDDYSQERCALPEPNVQEVATA